MTSLSDGCFTKQFTKVDLSGSPINFLDKQTVGIPAGSVDVNFKVGTPFSTSQSSTNAFSHPTMIPLPSQSHVTHVGFTHSSVASSSRNVNEARRCVRECGLVSHIFTVLSAAALARRGCCVTGHARLQMQFECPSKTIIAFASTTHVNTPSV